MNLSRLIVPLCCSLFIVGCNGSSPKGNQPPVIDWVVGDVKETHPTYYTKKGDTSNFTLSFYVAVKITDPDGDDDVTDIYFTDELGTLFSVKYDGYNGYWVESSGYYTRASYYRYQPDSLTLSGWTMFIEDSAGNKVQKEFSFPQPNLVNGSGESFVYTSAFAGIKTNGIQTLITPEALSTSQIDNINNVMTINYRRVDARGMYNSMYFYNTDGLYVGELRTSDFPNLGGVNVLSSFDITDGMITYQDGYTFSDIVSFHWVSMDDLTGSQEIINSSNWWRYKTISELYCFGATPCPPGSI